MGFLLGRGAPFGASSGSYTHLRLRTDSTGGVAFGVMKVDPPPSSIEVAPFLDCSYRLDALGLSVAGGDDVEVLGVSMDVLRLPLFPEVSVWPFESFEIGTARESSLEYGSSA